MERILFRGHILLGTVEKWSPYASRRRLRPHVHSRAAPEDRRPLWETSIMLTSPWHIQLLGGLRVRREAQVIDRFRSHRTGALLAYLAYHARRAHPREELIALFWPEADMEAGRTSLRTALSSLRHQLEPSGAPSGTVLMADRQNVQLRGEAIHADVADFEAALQAAKRADAPEQAECQAEWLQQAIAAYQGPLLPGYYEDWVLGERERLAAAYQNALCRLALILQQTGRGEQALDYARRALAQDALNEQAHCLLMRLYAANHQRDAALQQYAVLEHALQTELQAVPSASTQALYRRLQSQPMSDTLLLPADTGTSRTGVANSADATPTASELTFPADVGSDAPSSQTSALSAPSGRSHSQTVMDATAPISPDAQVRLPLQFTRFFGRESEREELAARLLDALRGESDPSAERLFTVTGPGGVGKTRFAVETGRAAAAQGAQRVAFVPLADIAQGERLLPVIAGALQLPPMAEDALAGQVATALRETPTLLILDNFEQLLNNDNEHNDEEKAGPAAVMALACLREDAPNLVLLVTSRQRLNLAGEREIPLPPLLTPEYPGTVERLLEFASVRLFVDRARAARPDFQITPRNSSDIAALCQALEGLPLAIELMAAWAQTLTPAQMRQRLDERLDLLRARQHGTTSRHKGLRACIEWSYRLLSPELQRFFAGLSVFRGGWTLEAAEAVCEEPNALEYLTQLRERSLITTQETETESGGLMRYDLLETLREYAWEQVANEERLPLRIRHARYVMEWAEELRPLADGAREKEWLREIAAEQSNIHQAFACCELCSSEAQTGLRLAAAVAAYWNRCGFLAQGRQTLDRVLANSAAAPLCIERGVALLEAGSLARCQGDYPASRAYQEAALAVGKQVACERVICSALNNLGLAALAVEDYDGAARYFTEDLQRLREAGREKSTFKTLSNLGTVAFFKADYAAARALYEQALALATKAHSWSDAAKDQGNIALILYKQGQPREALACHKKCLTGFREHNMRADIPLELESTAATLAALDQPVSSARLLGAAETLRKTVGVPLPPSERAAYEENVAVTRRALPPARFQSAWSEGAALSWEEAVNFALQCGESRPLDMSPPNR